MKIMVLISGKAGSGKDTAGDYFVSRYGFRKYAFADKLKEIAFLLGWDGEKDDRGRKLLQDLGTVGRAYDPCVWIKFLLDKISSDNPERIVVTDCRYANEFSECAEFASENGYILIPLHIVRRDAGLKGHLGEHESERECENIPAIIVRNDEGISELYEKLDFLFLERTFEEYER